MSINIFNEISWGNFIQLEKYKNLPLNEQEIYYKQYIQDLEVARQNWLNYQNKGRLVPEESQQEEAPGDPVKCTQGMDVVFLIDYTLSMSGVIEDVKTNVLSIVNTIATESGGDYRLGLVLFDESTVAQPFTYSTKTDYTSLPAAQRFINVNAVEGRQQAITAMEVMSDTNQTSFTTQLNKINTVNFPLGYGAGTPEPGGIGYEQILNDIAGSFRTNVAKLVILITDEYPGGDDDLYIVYIDDVYLQGLAATGLQENVQVLVLSKQAYIANKSYAILSDGTNGIYSESSTLSPADIITAIQDICTQNA
jgi:hypothetical protein